METSPLTLAHTHARNAAQETKRANPVAASEEHDLAAAEFAAAAQSTTDSEALRILNLLEQHHKKLGQILKTGYQAPTSHESAPSVSANKDQDGTKSLSPPLTSSQRPTSPETATQPPRLVRTGRPTARDLSSSIASNLASARGIPNNRQKRSTPISPLVSNQHADGQFSQEEASRKSITRQGSESAAGTSRPSWAPPLDVSDDSPQGNENVSDPTASDVPFQQFYNTFESLVSKLSAPLAFAGLPLTSHTNSKQAPTAIPAPSVPPKSVRSKQQKPQIPPAEPLQASIDYSQLISRAAIRAVRNDNNHPGSESFYVVPTTGGTTSYADIMSRHQRNLSANTNDDFVDASSTILPFPTTNDKFTVSNTGTVSSPSHLPRFRPGTEPKHNGKTMEELSLENTALKHLSDTLSKRLHVFEMSAQTSSAALAQSIRSLHLSPLTTPETSRDKNYNNLSGGAGIGARLDGPSAAETARLNSRISELEEILRKSDARTRKKEEENVKLRDTLGKYREKWDSLKAGAKARRDRDRGGGGEGGSKQTKDKKERDRDRDDAGTIAGAGDEAVTGNGRDD